MYRVEVAAERDVGRTEVRGLLSNSQIAGPGSGTPHEQASARACHLRIVRDILHLISAKKYLPLSSQSHLHLCQQCQEHSSNDKLLRIQVVFAPDYEQFRLGVLFYSIGDELHGQLAISHFSTVHLETKEPWRL